VVEQAGQAYTGADAVRGHERLGCAGSVHGETCVTRVAEAGSKR
jgi:hypothetical protein